MLLKDEGIVLAKTRSGETSVQLTFLARAAGKIRLMAKGALTSRSPLRGALEPGNHLEVVYYFKEGRTLYFLKEATLVAQPVAARTALDRMAALLAALELTGMVCYPGHPEAGITELVAEFIRSCDSRDPLFLFLAFELRVLAELGSAPDLTACAVCGDDLGPGSVYSAAEGSAYCARHADAAAETTRLSDDVREAAVACTRLALAEVAREPVAPATRKALGRIVHWTYTHHVQGYHLPESLRLI